MIFTAAGCSKTDEKLSEDTQKTCEAFHDDANAAKMLSGKVRSAVDDAAITASIHAALLKDRDLSVVKVDVSTDAGEVRLTGKVGSEAAKRRAADTAQAVDGVRRVDNELVVASNAKKEPNA